MTFNNETGDCDCDTTKYDGTDNFKFYKYGTQCKECADTSISYANTSHTGCVCNVSGMSYDEDSDKCVCNASTYLNDKQCKACPDNSIPNSD